MNWRFWSRKLTGVKEDYKATVKPVPVINVTTRSGESIVFTYTLTLSSDDLILDRETIRTACLQKAERAVNRLIDGITIAK